MKKFTFLEKDSEMESALAKQSSAQQNNRNILYTINAYHFERWNTDHMTSSSVLVNGSQKLNNFMWNR